ncbi:spindle pole antigen [Scheffersomyces coipomensis]|uniref:spindle pole antigen n=1 Tax=Scheffersomyces coipomensis TaxID=1788519 RepID=UPI00315C728B
MSDKDLVSRYKELKQFLDISDDSTSRSKTNLSRAARAREKLLKLSSAQFKELSTDVYDELKRRIDESRGEPDYLLPKSSFHPKRNQARQKLSSLPQPRFKDLVSDISYEIERRNLHVELPSFNSNSTTSPSNNNISNHTNSHSNGNASNPYGSSKKESLTKSIDLDVGRKSTLESDPTINSSLHNHNHNNNNNYNLNHNNNNNNNNNSHNGIGIQSKTVVPTKANLTWSSDEEDVDSFDEKDDVKQINIVKDISTSTSKSSTENKEEINQLHSKIESLQSKNAELEEKYQMIQHDYNYLTSQNKSLSNEIESLSAEKLNLLNNQEKTRSVNFDDELSKLKSANAALRLENQSLKNTTSPVNKHIDIINNNNSSSTIKPTSKKDVESFIQKLNNLELSKSNNQTDVKKEILKLQNKYEDARSNSLSKELLNKSLDKESLKHLTSSHGLISMKLVSDLQSMIESFLIYLNTENDSDILFEKISKLSVIANEIASQGESQVLNSNEYSVCLREAVSYALTTTRYFAVYDGIIPKAVVERSIGEVNFSLCDLISSVKMKENSSNSRQIELDSINDPINNNNNNNSNNHSVSEDFGVRPLRMADKLREAQTSFSNDNSSKQQQPSQQQDEVVTSPNSRLARAKVANAFTVLREKKEQANEPNSPINNKINQSPIKVSPKSKNISALTSKFETKQIHDEEPLQRGSPKGSKAPGITYLATKLNGFETSPKDSFNNHNNNNNNNKTTPPRKLNILDKVRQFEDPDSNKSNSSSSPFTKKAVNNIDSDISSTSIPMDEPKLQGQSNYGNEAEHNNNGDQLGEAAIITSTGAAATAATAAVAVAGGVEASKGKGLFQNLRDRLAVNNGNVNGNDNTHNNVQDDDLDLNEVPNDHQEEEDDDEEVDGFTTIKKPVKSVSYSEDTKSGANNGTVTKPRQVVEENEDEEEEEEEDDDDETEEEIEARQRQEYRKSMAAATFNVNLFDIDDPDNTLTQVLLYLEHQTVEVISTIQSLLATIKKPNATRGDLRDKSKAITIVISQMTEATNTSMNQTRNAQLKEHGSWVVKSLEDCHHRMIILCRPKEGIENDDSQFADKNFKQRLAGISFDIAKCTKELVKTVEEASLKEDIEQLDARIKHGNGI